MAAREDAPSRDTLLAQLAQSRPLIVLDNLEQIPDAALAVEEILAAAPQLTLVATSRRALHVVGEHEHAVAPLRLPARDGLREVEASEAVQLFCRHAHMVRHDFELSADNANDVAALCRRLDGLPLAMELAGARTKLLSPAAVLARLKSSVDLRGPATGRPDRHQALRNTIAWSYDLLTPGLQTSFRRLGVFTGGADLDAVAAVAVPDGVGDPLDLVADLLDASLATAAEGQDRELRVTLLQTVADFAVDQLPARGEDEEVRTTHARHYLAVAEPLALALFSGQRADVLQRLQTERDNFRSALTWTLRPDDDPPPPERAMLGLRLCAALFWFWHFSGANDTIRWLRRAVEVDSGGDSLARALALHALASETDPPASQEWVVDTLTESLEISRRLDDTSGAAETLTDLAGARMLSGDLDGAAFALDESDVLARESRAYAPTVFALMRRADLEAEHGLVARAVELCQQMRQLARARGDENGLAWGESNLADHLSGMGRGHEALTRLPAITPVVRRVSNLTLGVRVLGSYAIAFAAVGEADRPPRPSAPIGVATRRSREPSTETPNRRGCARPASSPRATFLARRGALITESRRGQPGRQKRPSRGPNRSDRRCAALPPRSRPEAQLL